MKKIVLIGLVVLTQIGAYGQLQNASFENWEQPINDILAQNRPVGWIRTNGWPHSEAMNFYHSPTSPAQDGQYALSLSIWYTYDKDMAKQIAPIDYRPTALTGFYTYTDNFVLGDADEIINDVATASVRLTKLNTENGEQVLIGDGFLSFSATPTFSPFTCAINYVSDEIPDTIEVLFNCSMMDKVTGMPMVIASSFSGVNSILTIDNIALTTQSLTIDDLPLDTVKLYPNPVQDILYLQGVEGEISVFDMAGRLVSKHITKEGSINMSSLEEGVYILTFHNNSGIFSRKIVKR